MQGQLKQPQQARSRLTKAFSFVLFPSQLAGESPNCASKLSKNRSKCRHPITTQPEIMRTAKFLCRQSNIARDRLVPAARYQAALGTCPEADRFRGGRVAAIAQHSMKQFRAFLSSALERINPVGLRSAQTFSGPRPIWVSTGPKVSAAQCVSASCCHSSTAASFSQ
jgi:hypothetical protein